MLLKEPSAFIPLLMSFAAFAIVLAHLATAGAARQADEGAEAHLWQLLMAGQLPVIAFFAMGAMPRDPRRALSILLVQGAAGIVAAAPVFLLSF